MNRNVTHIYRDSVDGKWKLTLPLLAGSSGVILLHVNRDFQQRFLWFFLTMQSSLQAFLAPLTIILLPAQQICLSRFPCWWKLLFLPIPFFFLYAATSFYPSCPNDFACWLLSCSAPLPSCTQPPQASGLSFSCSSSLSISDSAFNYNMPTVPSYLLAVGKGSCG